jgi:hypothetical protein
VKLISNLHHSDTVSGTTVIQSNGVEYRAHWTEGDSDVVICEGGLRGGIVGVIRGSQAAEWEDDLTRGLRAILAAPGENARAMTAEEEADWQGATGAAV